MLYETETGGRDILLLKEGEIVLKGLNKRLFEQKLVSNVIRAVKPHGNFRVYAVQSTVYVEPQDDGCDVDGAWEAAKAVFGVVTLARAAAAPKDPDTIARVAVERFGEDIARAKSFKVETRRADKRFPMTSIELSQYVGGVVSDAFPHVPVDVHEPDFVLRVEIRDLAAYIHGRAETGSGGMPVGTNGRVVSLLSGGIDSPVSTYLAAKRGVSVFPVHFFSFPYTSELAKQKVVDLARILQKWCGGMTLQVVPFTRIQEEIRDKCPEEYFTVIMRRFMMRLAQKVADAFECGGIVTGESLGQVASQTLEAMRATEACAQIPVLRPLVCMDKEEIVRISRKLGTFDTSVLPYEDCCTVFTPKHPKTKPRLHEVAAAEASLDVEGLVNEAFEHIERVRL